MHNDTFQLFHVGAVSKLLCCKVTSKKLTLLPISPSYALYNFSQEHRITSAHMENACGTWQFCLHNDEPCGFVTFLCVSVATHVTARGVRMITIGNVVFSLAACEDRRALKLLVLRVNVKWSSSVIVKAQILQLQRSKCHLL